ncbi:MAG: LapA family protein [Thermomicrobiales bacterium]|nr:LapA family protein [Thermomicrobiales bacterium]MCO5222114.1 LapA family protein [Thermomicrobiales bacterium]
MTDKLPTDKPAGTQPPGLPPPSPSISSGRPEPDKRPVAVRAKETANTGYRAIRWIVLIVLVVVATLFIARNFEHVEVDWVIRTSEMRLSLVMLGFLLTGVVIGWLIHWFSARAQRRQ